MYSVMNKQTNKNTKCQYSQGTILPNLQGNWKSNRYIYWQSIEFSQTKEGPLGLGEGVCLFI